MRNFLDGQWLASGKCGCTAEEEVPPEVAVQLQPMTREPAQPLEGSSAQLYVAPVNRPSLAIQD